MSCLPFSEPVPIEYSAYSWPMLIGMAITTVSITTVSKIGLAFIMSTVGNQRPVEP